MDSITLASGDNNNAVPVSPRNVEDVKENTSENNHSVNEDKNYIAEKIPLQNEITPQMIEDNELKLKERIAQCRSIIESLKFELNAEKVKIERETTKPTQCPLQRPMEVTPTLSSYDYVSTSDAYTGDLPYTSNVYSVSVDSKLLCDENLMEYEKQLQKYQNTLNMAQIEKKNAIRKQMLAKAYRLKLLEVENQCNIELLRVKQSLQCLAPLQMIANKWKVSSDEVYDCNSYELIPRYPELSANSGSDFNSNKEDFEANKNAVDKSENNGDKDDSVSSDF